MRRSRHTRRFEVAGKRGVRLRILAAALALAALALVTASSGIDRMVLRLGSVNAGHWRASDITVTIRLGAGGPPSGALRVGQLQLGEPLGTLRDIRITCARLLLGSGILACEDGRLDAGHPALARGPVPLSFRLALNGDWLAVTAPAIAVGFDAAGGTRAAQDLVVGLGLELHAIENGWRFTAHAEARAGQGYLQPLFVDFSAQPLRLQARGRWGVDGLHIDHFRLHQPGVFQAQGNLRLDPALGLTALGVTSFTARFPAFYATYLQPFAIGTPLGRLTTDGQLAGSLRADAQGLVSAQVAGAPLTIEDANGRFSLRGARLEINWQREARPEEVPISRLAWSSAALGKITLGPASLAWHAAEDSLRLAQPARIPLLGGELVIAELAGLDLTSAAPRARLDARLTPIDLGELTRALGWPAFSGTLAGDLPGLSYRDGTVTLAGNFTARVFDGQIEIANLRIRNPLGVHPRMRLDARARGLDLALLTSAFDFGRITGPLAVDVNDLRLLDWFPVAFDAWLRTPPGDHSSRHISQRAIDSLASIGGGATGLVSRGFLQFFDEFAYERIGLGCRLASGVCHMRGLEPAAGGGYVIVRGAWFPRITVIGHNQRVDWPLLLRQLQAATAGAGPVVQ